MSMTVRDLKELLATANDDDLVILQKDAEGNGHSPLAGAWQATYVADSTWSGETYLRELDDDAIKDGFTEDDLAPEGVPAVVLYPVN